MLKQQNRGLLRTAFVSAFFVGGTIACVERMSAGVEDNANDAGTSPPSFILPSADAGTSDVEISDTLELCVATECPPPFATCPYFGSVPEYACSIDLSSDPDNCGKCGHKCPNGSTAYRFTRACSNGACQPLCQSGYADCNGIPDDGCESNSKTDPDNCGICGNKCADGVACIDGKCGCPPGMTNCNGTCVDMTSDDSSCGACAYSCKDHQPEDAGAVPPNMFYGCDESECKLLRCYHDSKVFWADCNDSLDPDGCEVDLEKPNADHCGKCDNQCDAKQECFSTTETGMDCQCKGGKHLCSAGESVPQTRCVDLESDPKSCGSCGYTCPTIEKADPACRYGRCEFTCQPGYADCNGSPADGCEVDLNSDPRSCGSCGNACDFANGQPCAGGKCATKPCDADGGPIQ